MDDNTLKIVHDTVLNYGVMDANLEPLREAIRRHGMMEYWRDSLTETPTDEEIAEGERRALLARAKYLRLMRGHSDTDNNYRRRAINIALDIGL